MACGPLHKLDEVPSAKNPLGQDEMYQADEKNDRMDQRVPRILVVDDDETILELVQDVLSEDYKVTAANNAAEALELLAADHFDLLILDLGIPGLSGIDAIQKIRQEQRKTSVPILVVSAYNELRRLVGDLQVDAVLAKPFALSQLELRVAELLGRQAPSGDTWVAAA